MQGLNQKASKARAVPAATTPVIRALAPVLTLIAVEEYSAVPGVIRPCKYEQEEQSASLIPSNALPGRIHIVSGVLAVGEN